MQFRTQKLLSLLFLTLLIVISGCVGEKTQPNNSIFRSIPQLNKYIEENEEFQTEKRSIAGDELDSLEKEGFKCPEDLKKESYDLLSSKNVIEFNFWLEKDTENIKCIEVLAPDIEKAKSILNWTEVKQERNFPVYFKRTKYKSCESACEEKGYSKSKKGECISFIDCESGQPVLSSEGAPCTGNQVCCCQENKKDSEEEKNQNCESFCQEEGFSGASNKECIYPIACVTGNHPHSEDEGAPCSGISVCCCRTG